MAEKLCELRKKGGGGGKYTETVLWTNPNPSVAFSAQTVTLSDSISNYKYVAIYYKYAGTNIGVNDPMPVIVPVDKFKTSLKNTRHNILALGAVTNGNAGWTRNVFYASDTTIEFDIGYKQNAVSSSGDICVPIEILGLNELAHGKNFDETTLWTNNAPTSSFSAKTVNLSDDITNYDYIKINYRVSTTVSTEAASLISVSDLLKMTQAANTPKFGIGGYIAASYTRAGYCPSTTSIYISSCYQLASTSEVNNGAIPTSIVGCKFR